MGCYLDWLSGCNPQKLSAIINDLNHIEGHAIQKKQYKRYCISAAYEHVYGPESKTDHSKGLWTVISKKLDAFCQLSRPHTVLGTVVGITSVSLLPIESIGDLSPIFFVGLLKVNKPNLPLASGEFSRETGIVIVVAFCTMSFSMGLKSQSPPLLCTLLISFFLGSAYQSSCIVCVRAILVQLAFFVHMQRYVLGRPVALIKSVVFAKAFMCFFSAVIALFKDIPDVDGDREFGIQSFSVRQGQERVFWLCIKLLLTAYGIAMLVGASSSNIYRLVTVLGHGLLASVLWFRAHSLDIQNKASITSFYMFVWKAIILCIILPYSLHALSLIRKVRANQEWSEHPSPTSSGQEHVSPPIELE